MRTFDWRRLWLGAAGLLGAVGVAFGAYAAHGLTGHEQELAAKASHFALLHALALLALSRGDSPLSWAMKGAGSFFILGSVLFCGTLAVLALTSLPVAGLAPFGGTSLILGWALLAVSALRPAA